MSKPSRLAPALSYAAWCDLVGRASGRHGTRIAFGPEACEAWAAGELADTFAARQPLSRLAGPLGAR